MKLFTSLMCCMLLVFVGFNSYSQTLVSTSPQNKNTVIEEFTGIKCTNCPAGHAIAASILSANPGRAIVVGMHPTNSSYTTPSAGQPDFRRAWCDAFYTSPYTGTSRFMPSAHVNRRKWPNNSSERILSRTLWASSGSTIMSEPSPVNIGLSSTYSQLNDELNITVEVYFTSNVSDPTAVTVMITESGLVGYQSGSGGGANYTHNHVFREALTAQWGDAITGPTTAGTLVTMNFTYDNSTTNYDIDQCHVIAHVSKDYNQSPGDNEIYTGVEVVAKNGSSTSVNEISESLNDMTIFPNPAMEESIIDFSLVKSSTVNLSVYNVLGELIHDESLGKLGAGEHTYRLPVSRICFKGGAYFVKLSDGEHDVSQKLIVQ